MTPNSVKLLYPIINNSDGTNNNSDNYDEKYMKIKFNSDDDLPLQKTLELYDKIITVTFLFNDGNKYYPQVFLVEYLFKLAE